ncbi:hypothetical protein XALC_2562 [Xanthomonas albilineans GPE PC73]|uniref:Uncharacterized protein n=1 Tax=Xanthomonas albilineans (strain GPE PC73 / CFBP 7063) TaxID=380358 RepID=D2UF80_XANAP|nr:hypothetical protein XALC_2562 [Xanthomonas albilineans GPE PC73]
MVSMATAIGMYTRVGIQQYGVPSCNGIHLTQSFCQSLAKIRCPHFFTGMASQIKIG